MSVLANRIAIVTGAAQGLGEGIARRFAQEGAVVVCADLQDATEVAASLPAAAGGRRSRSQRLDVTDKEAVEAPVPDTLDQDGRPDIPGKNPGHYHSPGSDDAPD